MPKAPASVFEIERFLGQVRKEIARGRCILVDRQKNIADIARLGLNWKYEICALTYQDYDKGPEPDHSGEGDVWVFVPEIEGTLVYIKLKLDPRCGVKCISFHKSNGPITLPYRNVWKEGTP